MDVVTILILGAIILLLGSFCLLVVRLTNRRLNGLGLLGGMFASGGISAIFYLVGGRVSPLLEILGGDVCVLLSVFLLHLAVLELLEGKKRIPWAGIAGLMVLAAVDLAHVYGLVSDHIRVLAVSLLVVAQVAMTATLLWKAARDRIRGPAVFLAVLLSAFAAFNIVRGVGEMTFPPRLHWGRAFLVAALVLYVVTAIGVAFGFFWLTTMKFSLQLEDAAGTDPLTRLYNRRTFLRACEIEMSNSQRAHRTFSILMLDLDHFKQINDRYGHPVGDMALVATVKCMTESVRGMDTIARWGGEEFAVLLPNCNRVNALELAERIRGNLERLALPVSKRTNAEGEKVTLTATIGVAMCQTTDTVNSLISRADQAMYAAKAAGRNRVLSASEIGSGEWRVVSGESAG